jgi:hypothetical protein
MNKGMVFWNERWGVKSEVKVLVDQVFNIPRGLDDKTAGVAKQMQ